MSRYTNSQEALPMTGTLFAMFEFKIYNKKRKPQIINLEGNATSSNCTRNRKQMFRNAFLDAKYRLFGIIGGSYKYTSKLLDYVFFYLTDVARGKHGQIGTIREYNNEIPETERNYEPIKKRTRENKPIIRTYKRTTLFDTKTTRIKEGESIIESKKNKTQTKTRKNPIKHKKGKSIITEKQKQRQKTAKKHKKHIKITKNK